MLREFFEESSGPYLAVVDGRYLPLDDLSVDIQHDLNRKPVHSFSGQQVAGVQQRGQSELTLELTTRRDPMMRDHHRITDHIYLFNRDYKMTLRNFENVQYGIGMEFGHAYELEFHALDWEIEER